MSTEVLNAPKQKPPSSDRIKPAVSWRRDLRTVKIVRFTVGSTVAAGIAFAYEWPLSFLTPVLTIVFLSKTIPGLTHRSRNLIISVLAAVFLGTVFTLFLLPYPMLYAPLLGLTLFNIYYLANRGGPFLFVVMSLLAVLLLPMMGSLHEALALGFAGYFVFGASLAIIIFTIAHVLFPDPPGTAAPPELTFQPGYSQEAAQAALRSTLVILPLVLLFLTIKWQSMLLAVIYAGIISLIPEVAAGWAMGVKLLRSTILGGLAGIVVYWMLVAVPEYYLLLLVYFVTMLIFANVIFSEHPLSKYMGSAATAMTILLASSFGPGADFGDKMIIRVLLIGLASVYVPAALAVIDRYLFAKIKK